MNSMGRTESCALARRFASKLGFAGNPLLSVLATYFGPEKGFRGGILRFGTAKQLRGLHCNGKIDHNKFGSRRFKQPRNALPPIYLPPR